MTSFGVFVSWWSSQINGMPFCLTPLANSLDSSALSRMKIASGFSSSTFFRYCSLRSGNDFIAMPLPLLIALRRIRNEQRPSTSLSKKKSGFCEASRCCFISLSCSGGIINKLPSRLGLVLGGFGFLRRLCWRGFLGLVRVRLVLV